MVYWLATDRHRECKKIILSCGIKTRARAFRRRAISHKWVQTAMVVVTFLAVLEMARESLLDIAQTSPFEPIYVKLRDAEMPALVS